MQRVDERKGDGLQNHGSEYWELMAHLENAVFLQAMDASFIHSDPEKLLDAQYCREWVQGVAQDFVSERDTEEAAQILSDLVEARKKFERLLPGINNERPRGVLSAAHELLALLDRICDRRLNFGQIDLKISKRYRCLTDAAQGSVGNWSSDFKESFTRRFITIYDDFDAVLPSTREATWRYIKKADIRILEISREVKFLYR
ncbi:MAG: hypothetical protein U5J63_07955 [Fodinibius sp.]|nr:hypothetical protein [Fodinibius sp.]